MRQPCVYILASRPNRNIYVGVTSNLLQRVWQHKNDQVEGFTSRYEVHTLVWYEAHETMEAAIAREKSIKEWKRAWKMGLVGESNPEWNDLYEQLA
jgi:putative endonuclease